jgi:hypothetical protein
MSRIKKSSFYHTRTKLVLNKEKAAGILNYTIEQIENADKNGDQLAERFLLLHDRKEIGFTEWRGWCFSRGVLRYGRQQWRPDNILHDRKFRESLEMESREIIKIIQPSINGA